MADDPAGRERQLAAIDPDGTGEHHSLLRRILSVEAQYRRDGEPGDYFENFYWCAFLLYCVGDVDDALTLWRAKHTDFDSSLYFDWQYLLGAGVEPTLSHLRDTGHADIADLLADRLVDEPDLEYWEQGRRRYFYPPDR